VEVAPQFFKVADANKISKRKRQEKIEPLFNKVCIADDAVHIACSHFLQYEKPDEWRLSKVKRSARSVSLFYPLVYLLISDASPAESNIWLRIVPAGQTLYCTM
jgi:ATP-dependent RNA helicase DHX8/PRP22